MGQPVGGGGGGGGAQRGEQQGALRDKKDRDLFEVGRVAALWPSDPPRTPPTHITYGHLPKTTPGSTAAPGAQAV